MTESESVSLVRVTMPAWQTEPPGLKKIRGSGWKSERLAECHRMVTVDSAGRPAEADSESTDPLARQARAGPESAVCKFLQ